MNTLNIIEFLQSRYKNAQFYIRLILVSFLPIMTIMGISGESLTSWPALWRAFLVFIGDPYLVFMYALTLYQSFKNTGTQLQNAVLGQK